LHDAEQVDSLEKFAERGGGRVDPDTVVSPPSVEVAKLAVGAVCDAVNRVLSEEASGALCLVRPPGHHALPERAMGFCLFSNIALGAQTALDRGTGRVLIVDWDVHHGNGTQDIFYADPSVFYFSTHQWPYYPGSGAATETGSGAGVGATLNVPLASGDGDAEIVAAFTHKLLPAAQAFRPQFVFVSAGFDAHRDDPLAGLEVSEAGYRELTRIVMDIANRFAEGRLVSLLEGGYDLNALSHSVEAHLRQLSE